MKSSIGTFARKMGTGDWVGVGQVARGLACECVCPGCGAAVVAQKAERAWCFAHLSNACGYSPMTALHRIAQELLAANRVFAVPGAKAAQGLRRISFSHVDLEVKLPGLTPDAVAVVDDDELDRLAIEILVHHAVDREKAWKYEEKKLPAIEVDLRRFLDAPLSMEELRRTLIDEVDAKKWIWRPRQADSTAPAPESTAPVLPVLPPRPLFPTRGEYPDGYPEDPPLPPRDEKEIVEGMRSALAHSRTLMLPKGQVVKFDRIDLDDTEIGGIPFHAIAWRRDEFMCIYIAEPFAEPSYGFWEWHSLSEEQRAALVQLPILVLQIFPALYPYSYTAWTDLMTRREWVVRDRIRLQKLFWDLLP